MTQCFIRLVSFKRSHKQNVVILQNFLPTLNTISRLVSKERFSGIAYVFDEQKNLIWEINCTQGKFHKTATKYFKEPGVFTLKTHIQCTYFMGLLNGDYFVYDQTGKKLFQNHYLMGLIDGPQKHYMGVSRFVHTFKRDDYVESEKQAKSWIWSDAHSCEESLVELQRFFEIKNKL